MIGVGVRRMAVVRVVMVMRVVMCVLMPGRVLVGWAAQGQGNTIGLAGPCALPLAEGAALHQAFHVVMVAVLGGTHFLLEAEHLGSVLAQRTVHVGVATKHIGHPLPEGGQY
jgi:hypothetical protein